MKRIILSAVAAVFFFIAIVMIAAAAGMMDQDASISVCIRLAVGSLLAYIAATGFAGIAED